MLKLINMLLFMLFVSVAQADFRGYLLDDDWWKTATLEEVRQQVGMSPNLNKTDDVGRTPLMYAVMHRKSPEAVKMLLEKSAKVRTEDDMGMTPLLYALRYKADTEIIDLLLQHGADVNTVAYDGRTPLYEAILNDFPVDTIAALVKKGADVKDCCNLASMHGSKHSLLMTTIHKAEKGDEKFVRIAEILLENGADATEITSINYTPLIYAIELQTSPKMIDLLVKYGADINKRVNGNLPLMSALRLPNPVYVSKLLAYGADVSGNAGENETLFCYALKYGARTETIQHFIDHGAEVQPADATGGVPLVCAASEPNNTQVIELLLTHGAEVNMRDKGGHNALERAANAEIAEILIQHGAKIDARDNSGRTVLMKVQSAEVVDILIKYGADINARDSEGRTVLMWLTVNKAERQAIEKLLMLGADVGARDNDGNSVADYAERYYPEIGEMLEKYGAY